MLPNTRIRLVKAPVERQELRHAEGRVVSLVPRASDPLNYKIKIKAPMESGENSSNGDTKMVTLEVPATFIKVLDYEGDDDEVSSEPGQMLVVNGLCYCKDHRLEICGKCGYNFRAMNISSELQGENMDKDLYLAEELEKICSSIRRAPSTQIVPFELYEPVVNDAILGVPSDLDVITLDDFPQDKPLFNAFESQFITNVFPQEREEMSLQPLHRVRKIFADIGYSMDVAMQKKIPLPLIFLQDEAQSVCLSVHVIATKILVGDLETSKHVMKWRKQIIAIGWSCVQAGDFNSLQASLAGVEKGTLMKTIQADTHVIELFSKIIEGNAAKISAGSRGLLNKMIQKVNPFLKLGVIAPISPTSQKDYYNLLGEYCDFCTASACILSKCSRCRSVQYCSKACQKEGWKSHRNICEPTSSK